MLLAQHCSKFFLFFQVGSQEVPFYTQQSRFQRARGLVRVPESEVEGHPSAGIMIGVVQPPEVERD